MKRCCFVFALIYCFAKTVVFAQTIPHPLPTDELPVVYVLGTGGTIAGAGSTRIAGNYDPSKVTIQDIIKLLPELTQIADVRTEQVCMVSSQDMTEKLWLALAKRVNELLAQPQVRGVVITHGTDTMEETAYFLSLTVKSDKAVVLVGSMRPPTSLSPDGPLNLFQAVLLATKPEAQKLGVLVAMNGKIFDAREVTKTHTTAVESFQGINHGQIGDIFGTTVQFSYRPTHKSTTNTPFDVRKLNALPQVGMLYGYAAAERINPVVANALVNAGVQGIVHVGVGNGNIPASTLPVLVKAAEKGIVVVRSSRVPRGQVTVEGELNDRQLGFVAGRDLNPQKTRILLMLALTKTKDRDEIEKIFAEY